jgi:hypothetical protein
MKKKLLIFFLLLVLVVGGVFTYLIMNAGSIAKSYKPEMEKMASDALGSTVELGDFSVKLFPNASIVIDSVTVTDPARSEESLSLQNLFLSVELMPLLSKKVSITEMGLENADITFYMEEDGIFLAGLPRAESSTSTADTTSSKPASETSTSTESAAESSDIPITVDLKSFALRNVNILVKDMIADTEYTLTGLDVDASLRFENNKALLDTLKGDARAMEAFDIAFNSTGAFYDIPTGTIAVGTMTMDSMDAEIAMAGSLNPNDSDQHVTIKSSNVDLEKLEPFFGVFMPDANEYGLAGTIKPDLTFALTKTGFNADGTIDLSGVTAGIENLVTIAELGGSVTVDADEKLQVAKAEGMNAKLNGAPVGLGFNSELTEKDGKVSPATMTAFDGTADTSVGLDFTDESLPMTAKLTIQNMQVDQLVAAFAPEMPFNITGTLSSVNSDITGVLDETMMASIKGDMSMLLSDGLIREVNLGSQVLGSVKDIPFVSGALLSIVPAEMQAFIDKEHTVLESVSGSFVLADEIMTTDNLKIVSDFFALDATGTIGFDTHLNLESAISFNQEFSAKMVEDTSELSTLLDDQGRLSFPVKVSGIAPDLTVVPNVQDLLKGAAKNAVKEEATKAVTDALGEEAGGVVGGVVDKLFKGRKKKKKN